MGRRAALAALAACLALAASGCAGAPFGAGSDDTAEASALLSQAEAALAHAGSVRLLSSLTLGAEKLSSVTQYAGFTSGKHAGDYLSATTLRGRTERAVAVGGRLFVLSGGSWHRYPVDVAHGSATNQFENQLALLHIGPYLEHAEITRDAVFLGEPVTKIAAVLDQKAKSADSLSASPAAVQGAATYASLLAGDVRVVVYVSRTTHLVRALHEEYELKGRNGPIPVTADISLEDAGAPLEIAPPAAT